MKTITLILKTVERCNINCTYCYFFNKADQSYKLRKPYISRATIIQWVTWVNKGIKDLNISKIFIGLHGGEPLMQKKADFDWMCSYIMENVKSCDIQFTLQTNGMLIDEAWIELFCKFKIGLGISLDGTKKINDMYRLDKKGRGTYERVVEKIRQFQTSKKFEELGGFGLLAVVNPAESGRDTYRHFIDELDIKIIDFLLPDFNYADLPNESISSYGKFLYEVFQEWINDDEPSVKLRFGINFIEMLMGSPSLIEGVGPRDSTALPIITTANNGDIGPLDELRSVIPTAFTAKNIYNTEMVDLLAYEPIHQMLTEQEATPEKCQTCCWWNICRGGPMVTRYSKENGFLNPSIYCTALQSLYKSVITFLLSKGYSTQQLRECLLT